MSLFQDRLRELKDSSEETQLKISEAIGVTPQAFSYYVNGREPSYDVLIKIAQYFKVSCDWLLGVSDVKSADASIRSVSEYTGLSEGAIKTLVSFKTALINKENTVTKFISEIFEDADFKLLIYNLYDYHNSIKAENIFDYVRDIIFRDDNYPVGEGEVLERQLLQKLQQIENDIRYPKAIRESLATHCLIWTDNGSERKLAENLIGVDGFNMSELAEFRASKYLLALLDSIQEKAILNENELGYLKDK